jgi:hypothetical protein
MSDTLVFEKTVETDIMKVVGSKLMFNASVDGEKVLIQRLYVRKDGDQNFSEIVLSKDMLREIYEATL